MKHTISICFTLMWVFLLVSCSPAQNSDENQAPKNPAASTPVPAHTTRPTEEKPLPTQTLTSEPTSTPTQTEIEPVLNGTPSAPLEGPIEKTNVDRVQIVRKSGSQRNITVLGKSGDRWFTTIVGNLLVHDTITGEILWKTDLAPDLNQVDNSGQVAFKIYGDTIQIVKDTGDNKKFQIPKIEGIENGGPHIAINFPKELYAIGVSTPFFYKGPPIPVNVYKWGSSGPLYTFTGDYFGFSTSGEYLTYLLGKNLEIVDAESGKFLTEFGLNNENFRWMTSWDDKYIAFSRSSTVEIWRLEGRKLIRTLQEKSEEEGQAFQFKFSGDSQSILVLQPGKTIRTWSISSGEMLKEEQTDETDLNRIGISNDGNILHFDLPQVPGRDWNSDFNDGSYFSFSNNGQSLIFSNQSTKIGGTTEKCEWEFASSITCDFHEDQIWILPANYRLLTIGNDNNRYFMKSRTEPVSLHEGWEEGGKFLAQIPKISAGEWGYLAHFSYFPEIGLIVSNYSDGKIFIYNSKTNGRLLLEGKIDRFFLSKDGNILFELVNKKDQPTEMEFVQYDSKSLKEISRTPLKKTIPPSIYGKMKEDLTPQLSSARLAPDGRTIFAYIIYSSDTEKDIQQKPIFLTIPLDDVEEATRKELEINSGQTSNMLVSKSGDLAMIAQTGDGDLFFIDTATGKIIHRVNIGGYPIKLALSPDGELIAAADMYNGIQLIGVPKE
ncbi:MAG: hypothetical protein AB9891_11040 [Anaerolineaceae bacterium]